VYSVSKSALCALANAEGPPQGVPHPFLTPEVLVMDEELRAIRAQEAIADSVYADFYGREISTEEQESIDDRSSLLGSVL